MIQTLIYRYISIVDANLASLPTLQEKLVTWAVKILAVHVNSLLQILRDEKGLDYLPKDCRTLIRTPQIVEVRPVLPGHCYHFGTETEIKRLLLSVGFCGSEISLFINVDGLPISESSSGQFWPILAIIRSVDGLSKTPFAIGLYYGTAKPTNSNDFLEQFTLEMSELMCNGFQLNSNIFFIRRISFICDAPALAFILNVKNYIIWCIIMVHLCAAGSG